MAKINKIKLLSKNKFIHDKNQNLLYNKGFGHLIINNINIQPYIILEYFLNKNDNYHLIFYALFQIYHKKYLRLSNKNYKELKKHSQYKAYVNQFEAPLRPTKWCIDKNTYSDLVNWSKT